VCSCETKLCPELVVSGALAGSPASYFVRYFAPQVSQTVLLFVFDESFEREAINASTNFNVNTEFSLLALRESSAKTVC